MRWMTLARWAVWVGALAPAVAQAQAPQTMTFTARVTDGDDALAGPHAMTFRLFESASGGTARWEEAYTTVQIVDGLVTVALGSTTPLTPTVLGGPALWVEVVLDGATMTPRLPLRSVPFAVRANDATQLGGLASSAFVKGAGDVMTGPLDVNSNVLISGKSALRGTDTWLRLNQDGAFTSGIHSPLNMNVSGLTVGGLYQDPGPGNLDITGFGYLRGGGRMAGISLGAAPFGALDYPYETMQLDPNYNLRIAFGSNEKLRLESTGRLWMSSNRGDCPSGWFCNGMFWDMSVSSIIYSGLNQRSDARLKQDIATATDGLATVRRLRPVTFAWRDPALPGRQHGFIAQEVQQVVPDLVSTTGDGMLSVETTAMIPILMQAVKELDAQNATLRAELAALRREDRPARSATGRPGGGPAWPSLLGLGLGVLAVIGVWTRRRA